MKAGAAPLLAGLCVAVVVALLAQAPAPARAATNAMPRIDLRVLLLGTSNSQSDFQDWQAALQREGIPFTAMITAAGHTPITAATLSGVAGDGTPVGYYEAIIVADGGLLDCSSGTCVSTLQQSEWDAIEQYERDFAVRQVTGDVYPGAVQSPGPDYGTGLNAPVFSGVLDGVSGSLTSDGQKLFPYLKAAAPVTFGPVDASSVGDTTWGSEATPVSTANFDTLVSGPGGSALVGIYTHPDGVQELEQTYASNQYLLQDQLLRHGVLAWATRGVYLGDQRNYSETEVDDTFISDDVWDPSTHQVDTNPADAIQESASDIAYAAQWSLANNFRIDMVFNGSGGTQSTNGPSLVSQLDAVDAQTARPYYDSFGWIDHTWDHPNLDQTCASSDYIQAEINENVNWAEKTLGLTSGTAATGQIDPSVVVTGEHSGLANLDPGTPGTVDPPDASTSTSTSGTLPAGTYTYAVSDQYAATGGESTASSVQVTLPSPGSVSVSWEAVCHAADYKVYREDMATDTWTLLATVNAGSGDFGPSTGSTTDVTAEGAQSLSFTDNGSVAGSSSSAPPTTNTATETPYQQNTAFTAALSALGISAFAADASKPYPDPADTTTGFSGGTYSGGTYPAGATFNEPGTNAWAVPRYPTNIYYNVATQAEELDEYNTIYPAEPAASFADVLDDVVNFGAGSMFAHLMGNDPRPSYFHQSNLIGGAGALYYATMNQLLSEYNSYFNVPIEQPTFAQTATLLREQAAWASDQAAATPTVSAYIQGNKVTVSNTGSSVGEVPLTGIPSVGSAYGGTTSGWTAAPASGTSAAYTAAISWPAPRLMTLTLAPATVTANGVATSVATLVLSNADGFPIAGEPPTLSATDPGVKISPVTDNGNGSYTATITASQTVGAVTITATDGAVAPNSVSVQATLEQTAAPAASLGLQLTPSSVVANGSSSVTATATVSDGAGHALSGQHLAITASDPGVKIGAVTDHGNGSYTATLTASKTAGAVRITATDSSVSPSISAQATLSQVAALDQVGPVVGTGSGTLTISGGKVPLTLSCPSGQSYCAGTVTIAVAGGKSALTLAQASFKLAGASSSSLSLTPSSSALKQLGKATSARVSVTASAVDAAGRTGTSSRTTTLYLANDRVAPRVRISTARLRLIHGAVAVHLACPSGQSYCDGRVSLRTLIARHRKLTLGGRHFHIRGGHGVTIRVGLHRTALVAMGRSHTLRAEITATARDRGGRAGSTTRVAAILVRA